MSKHNTHKWIISTSKISILLSIEINLYKCIYCENCKLIYEIEEYNKKPYYHYKRKIYNDAPSCEEIKMQEALS